MGEFHTAFEMARGHAHKRHAVAMLGVHIGLHFEDKARHLGFLWRDLAGFRGLGLWLGPVGADAVHQFLDAERVDGGAKPDGGHMPL